MSEERVEQAAPDTAVQGAGDGPKAGTTSSRTFTQEDVNRIVEERLARERQKYADYEALKKAKAELDKIKESQMSETERLQKLASEAERRAILLEDRIAQTEIKADFIEKAIAAGVVDVRLAYLAAQADGLLGAYDPDKGVGKHNFDELKKRYPHLFRTVSGSADGGASGGKVLTAQTINDWIRRAAGR